MHNKDNFQVKKFCGLTGKSQHALDCISCNSCEQEQERELDPVTRYGREIKKRVSKMPDDVLDTPLRYADDGTKNYYKTILAIKEIEKEAKNGL
jgi:hypothetical protein